MMNSHHHHHSQSSRSSTTSTSGIDESSRGNPKTNNGSRSSITVVQEDPPRGDDAAADVQETCHAIRVVFTGGSTAATTATSTTSSTSSSQEALMKDNAGTGILVGIAACSSSSSDGETSLKGLVDAGRNGSCPRLLVDQKPDYKSQEPGEQEALIIVENKEGKPTIADDKKQQEATATSATVSGLIAADASSNLSNTDSVASALVALSSNTTATLTTTPVAAANEQVELPPQPPPSSLIVSDATKTGTLASALLLLSSSSFSSDAASDPVRTPGKSSKAAAGVAATAAAAARQVSSNVSEAARQQQQQQSPQPAVLSLSSSSSQQRQGAAAIAAATSDGLFSSLSSTTTTTTTTTTTRKQPSSSSSSSTVAKQPSSQKPCRPSAAAAAAGRAAAARTTIATSATRTVAAQHQQLRHGPREELSFADARPCLEHAPTLDELQSQSFTDYVRHTVLRAALPRYRPEQHYGNDDIDVATTTTTSSTSTAAAPSRRAPARASKKKKTSCENIQSDAKNKNVNGGNNDNDSDDDDDKDGDEKVIVVEPDWTIQPMPLTQGMAKVTLPPGFWDEDGIGQDTTGRGPAWRAGTALGDLPIHSPIQQHVRGMAGIYEYTFMDHTSGMTMAEFRKLADDYQETQIPISLSLRKAKRKTPLLPSKKKNKNCPAASATTTSACAALTSSEAGTETEEANPNNEAVTRSPDTAVPRSSNDAINNAGAIISSITSPSELEVDLTDAADIACSKSGADKAGDDVGDVKVMAAEHGSDDDEDPAVHEYSNERIHKLEEKFWKRLGPTMSPAIYGADQEGTLFGDDPASGWSLDDLDSCLHVLPRDVPGVTSPYLYVGMWASVFCAHAEDMNLLSINYLHAGAPKIWYAIAPGADAQRFESLCEFHFLHGSSASAARPPPMAMNRTMGPSPSSRKRKKESNSSGTTAAPRMNSSGGGSGGGKTGKPQYCREFLRHKRTLLSPKILQRAGIRYTTTIQRPGEAIITFPSGYHFGFNIGFNVAEATNFAVPEWIPYGLTAKVCMCRPDSVRIDVARLIQLLQLYQKDLTERVAAAKRRYKNNGDNGFLSWKEWRELREFEKEKRQSKEKKKQRFPNGCGTIDSSNGGGRMNMAMACCALSDDQKSDQQRRNEFWVEVVKPVAKKERPQVQLLSLADQLRSTTADKIEEKEEEPIILEGKRKRKKSVKAAALEQEEQERLLERQQREQHQNSTIVEATQVNVQTASAPTEEIWHLAKPIIIPATGARNKQRRRLEVYTRVLCLLPGTVMTSGDSNADDDDDEEDEQCFAGQIVELSDDHVLVHLDGLPRSEDFWLPVNSSKLFLDGGRWNEDDNMVEGEKGAKKISNSPARGLPKLHYWQEIDSKDRGLSNEEND